MGLDLTILPVYGKSNLTLTKLECSRDYELFVQIENIQKKYGRHVCSEGIRGYFDAVFKSKVTDAYGAVVQSVPANPLKSLVVDNDRTNRAILAYIRELHDDHELYLYWH